jgi:hypothetical protein
MKQVHKRNLFPKAIRILQQSATNLKHLTAIPRNQNTCDTIRCSKTWRSSLSLTREVKFLELDFTGEMRHGSFKGLLP